MNLTPLRRGANTRIVLALFFGLFLLISTSAPIHAVTFEVGDVFAGVSESKVQHWRPGEGLLETLDTDQRDPVLGAFTTGMAFDNAGNLYVTNFVTDNITRFDSEGNVLAPNPFVTNDPSGLNESIVFDAAGNFYIGQAGGRQDIIKRNANGDFLERFAVETEERGSDWIDLAADQQTMFYTSEGRRILRYDVLNDVQLVDFATLPGDLPGPGEDGPRAFALRLLDDGGLLVADSVDIKRLNAEGAVVQTYDVSLHDDWFALNLDPDGETFWSGDSTTGEFHQFNIDTGDLLASFDTGLGPSRLFGLAVFGEVTQGMQPKPAPEPATLGLLAVGVVLFGSLTRRRWRL